MRISDILFEYREGYIANAMKQRLEAAALKDTNQKMDSVDIVEKLKEADPDPTGKNLQFIARMYAQNQFKLEDLARLKGTITDFYKFRNQLSIKDLNSLRDLNQLYDLVDPLVQKGEDPEQSKRQQEKLTKSDAVKLIDENGFTVIVPKTKEASQLYGSGTKWCTSAKENCQFDTYNDQGNLYIMILNTGGKQRKFQLHVESGQFMNERDQEVSSSDIKLLSNNPSYTKFLNGLVKKYYGRFLEA